MARDFDLLSEVLHEDVLDAPSGRKPKEIATNVGKPYVTLMGELKGQPGHKVSVDLLLPLMLQTGSKRPVHYLAARLDGVFIDLPRVAKGADPLSRQAIQTVKEVGDVMEAYLAASGDGDISTKDKQDVRKEIYEAVAALVAFGKALEDA
ncbi:MAG: phage regulatory CII family protein [Solidesulfovibrio sp. DCME]|uniref:phage regulatory CII family protein n=1 Tax=Solidesulfovibrio sp. DCME TaxID=3447380 RepID=UPI003D147BF6